MPATPKIWAYYEADSYSQADGSPIASNWTDKSGNGRHAAIVSGPIFRTNFQNGQPVLEFNGGGFNVPDMSAFTQGEIIVVAQLTGAGGTNQILLSMGTSGSGDLYGWSDGNIHSDFGSTSRNSSTITSTGFGNFNIVDIYSAANDWGVFFNNVSKGGTNVNTVSFPTVPKIGYFNGGNVFIGRIAAVYIYSEKLTTAERNAEYELIRDKYFDPSITTTTLPNGTVGTAYSQQLAVTGGTGSITWTIPNAGESAALTANGLSLDPSTGAITGTPISTGTVNFTVRAADANGAFDEQALSITVVPVPPLTATDGSEYHLFQLRCAVKEYNEGIQFATLKNELSDGYQSQTLHGAETGTRVFGLTLPSMPGGGLSGNYAGIDGEQVSAEQYLWSLYCSQEVTGKPFVLKSARNDQYYLVRFAQENLTYQRMLTKLYSTGIELKQARISNVSVFDPSLVSGILGYWDSDTEFSSNDWTGTDGTSPIVFVKSGDVLTLPDWQNGHGVKRFNGTTNDGHITFTSGAKICDVIMVMRMRESTFSNSAGILADNAGGIISGLSTTTKFASPSLSPSVFSYRLNGIEHEQDDMQAPMSEWGIVHFRWNLGRTLNAFLRIGYNGSGYAELDLGDVLVSVGSPMPMDAVREIVEHLVIKFGVGA